MLCIYVMLFSAQFFGSRQAFVAKKRFNHSPHCTKSPFPLPIILRRLTSHAAQLLSLNDAPILHFSALLLTLSMGS